MRFALGNSVYFSGRLVISVWTRLERPMVLSASVTVFVDNYCNRPGFRGEHGLSLLLTVYSKGSRDQIILDAGQTADTLIGNLQRLGSSLDDVRALVISHGHYDHTGGVWALMDYLGRPVPLVAHPSTFGPRFKAKPFIKGIGPDFTAEDIKKSGGNVILSASPVPLAEGLQTTGGILRQEKTETVSGFLRIGEHDNDLVYDEIEDDQAIVADLGDKGLVIVTGCCHAGLINTVRQAVKMTGNTRIKAIIGGLHLTGASRDRMETTAAFLRKIRPEILVPLHCTGRLESCFLRHILGDSVKLVGGRGRDYHPVSVSDAVSDPVRIRPVFWSGRILRKCRSVF